MVRLARSLGCPDREGGVEPASRNFDRFFREEGPYLVVLVAVAALQGGSMWFFVGGTNPLHSRAVGQGAAWSLGRR